MGQKTDLLLNCVSLGMEYEQAVIACELEPAEIEALNADATFQRSVRAKTAILERNLLDKLKEVIDFNMQRGVSTEIRYMLGIVNKRYKDGGSTQSPNQGNEPAGTTLQVYLPKNGRESP